MMLSLLSLLLLLFPMIIAPPASFAAESYVAKVNDSGITVKDLEEEVGRLLPQESYHGNVSEDRKNELREKALDSLIERELQYQDALARGLKTDRKKVKKRLEQVKESFASTKEYKATLSQAGITEQQLDERFQKDELINVAIENTVVEPSKIDDAGVKEYYDKNRDKYKQPESVSLRIISTKDEQKAVSLLARLKKGEDFGSIAATSSEDRYRVKGGDIGTIHRGSIYPELEKAAFALKPGELSDIIRVEGLWYILRVDEKTPEHQVAFEEIKAKLQRDLERKRANELREQWMSSLRKKANIEMFLSKMN